MLLKIEIHKDKINKNILKYINKCVDKTFKNSLLCFSLNVNGVSKEDLKKLYLKELLKGSE